MRSVLQGACHMVAMQISAEPLVRQALRQVFQSRALLSVKATKKGRKVCLWCVCMCTNQNIYVTGCPDFRLHVHI